METNRTGLDAALRRLALGRDADAWALLAERCQPTIERLARRLAGEAELAADAVQEAWLQIRDGAVSYQPRSDNPDAGAWGWIMRVTANAVFQLLRRRRRVQACRIEPTAPAMAVPVLAAEATEELRQALAELPEPTRAAVVLHHVEGLPFAQVAAALGCREVAAKVRVHRGLAVLRRRLQPSLGAAALCAALNRLPASESAAMPAPGPLLTASLQPQFAVPTTIGISSMKIASSILFLVVCGAAIAAVMYEPAPSVTPAPPAANPASSVLIIKPVAPIAVPPLFLASLEQPALTATAPAPDAIDWYWVLRRREQRGPVVLTKALRHQLESVPLPSASSTMRQTLDRIALALGCRWLARAHGFQLLPLAHADALARQLDGTRAPRGSLAELLAWVGRESGLELQGLDLLAARREEVSLGQVQASAEDWLEGLTQAANAALIITESGVVELRPHPDPLPMLNPPVPEGVYQLNPPKPGKLEQQVDVTLNNADIRLVADYLSRLTGIHYEVVGDTTSATPLTLRVAGMKLHHTITFVSQATNCRLDILPDGVRFVFPPPSEIPKPEAEAVPHPPHVAQ
jgi:RNA polymerase sigma-70 factor (ECF subfamily)